MSKEICRCDGPYSCKQHDGEFEFCTNPVCLCHQPKEAEKCTCQFEKGHSPVCPLYKEVSLEEALAEKVKEWSSPTCSLVNIGLGVAE